MKLIKSVSIRDYTVSLYESEHGWKVIFRSPEEIAGESETLEHLNIANYLFDVKVKELEEFFS
jgi:hypothetical protein